MEKLMVEALPREERGKNRARRLRRGGQVPAVVYGGAGGPQALSVDPRVVEKLLQSEAGRNAVFTLAIKGHGKAPAMIRDWQVEPVKGLLLHVDFLRIALDARLKVKVPIETRGEAVGVKQQGGVLEVVQREVEVECLPGDIPDELVLEVGELTIGKGIRVGDLKVDNRKLRILTDPDRVIVHVVAPRAVEEEKPAEEVVAVAAPAEPELIRKGKVEAEEEEEGKPEKPSKAAAEGEKK
ncbi:MAG TPA: 50S ribosomal protein L25 [Candidatus Acidoferrales bacterium]|nr:50S ribosomal protein L25 [Candidatus Acidoferrales bacterium]